MTATNAPIEISPWLKIRNRIARLRKFIDIRAAAPIMLQEVRLIENAVEEARKSVIQETVLVKVDLTIANLITVLWRFVWAAMLLAGLIAATLSGVFLLWRAVL